VRAKISWAAWAGMGLCAVVFGLYAWTLTPGVPPTDSGEMAMAAWLPGVAHAPGFPAYVVLGWVFSHVVPVGRVVWRLSLFSAFCGAAAAGLTYSLALRTLHSLRTSREAAPKGAKDQAGASDKLLVVAALAGALALGMGRAAWYWGTLAEVYALNTAIVAAILLLVLRSTPAAVSPADGALSGAGRGRREASALARREIRQTAPRDNKVSRGSTRSLSSPSPDRFQGADEPLAPREGRSDWALFVAAFIFGLGLGNHLTSIAVLAPGIAFWLTARRGWRFWTSRTAWMAALALGAGLAVYLYLPLRASANPLLNWGQPDTWQRFWWHVTAKQYRVSLFSAPVGPQLGPAAQSWWTQLTPLGLALMLAGCWHMARRQRALLAMMLLVIACTTLYALAYVIEDDQDAYYLPAFVAGAVLVAWGAYVVPAWLAHRLNAKAGARAAAAVALCLAVPASALLMNWSFANRSSDTISEDYVRDTLAEIGPRGLLLTRDWQFNAPALYLQNIEGVRTDITVIDTELMRRGWYFDYLHRIDPGLMGAVASEERAFLTLRDAWERGDIQDGDSRIDQLQEAYIALLNALVEEAARVGRPVHAGPNRGAASLRAATLRGQPDMEPGVGSAWRWIPVGLSFMGVEPSDPPPTLSPLRWQTAAFSQVRPSAPELKVQATRADMAVLRGLFRANGRDLAGAREDWQAALAVDPTNGPAQELMAKARALR